MTYKSSLSFNSRLKVSIFVTTLLIIFDQLTKFTAKLTLPHGQTYSFFADFISLSYVENPYGFLGVLVNSSENIRNFLLIFLVAVLLLFAVYYALLNRRVNIAKLLFTCFIFSGGLSNLLDRLLQEVGVIDFISFNFALFETGLCNFADLYIFVGGFGLGFLLTKEL